MKLLAVPLSLLVCACAVHAQAGPGNRPAGDLRSAIKQINQQLGGAVRPRQLSQQERAELRRQLAQHSRGRH